MWKSPNVMLCNPLSHQSREKRWGKRLVEYEQGWAQDRAPLLDSGCLTPSTLSQILRLTTDLLSPVSENNNSNAQKHYVSQLLFAISPWS